MYLSKSYLLFNPIDSNSLNKMCIQSTHTFITIWANLFNQYVYRFCSVKLAG